MKTTIPFRCLLALASLAAAGLPLQAAPSKMRVLASATAPEAKTFERRVLVRHGREKPELESVAFLGVETARVSPTLTAQLDLPQGAGLLVRTVVADSPAAAVLQPHDILLKLGDQLLIETRQLAVLIRQHKAGDEIKVTYVRRGKEAIASVKLGQHDAPKLSAFDGVPPVGESDFQVARPGDANRLLSLLDQQRPTPHARARQVPMPAPTAPGVRAMRVDPANSTLIFADEEGELALTSKDGMKTLVAKDAQGETLYSGPIDTPEQRADIPAALRTRLEKLESMEDVSFEAAPGMRHEFRASAPRPIALPLRQPARARKPSGAAL